MNQMEIFKNPEFGSIRVIEENSKYLFSGTDVAVALGYSNPRDAIIRHCRYVVKRDAPHPQSPDRKISMTFIPEGDLYRLIVHSKLPSAERFEQWVFDEILPTIRKHGAYLTKEKLWEVATSPEALMKLCSDLLAEREANVSLRKENAQLEGKAAFYDLFIDLKPVSYTHLQKKDHPDLWGRLPPRDRAFPLFEAGQLTYRVCHGLPAKEHHPCLLYTS